MFPPAEDGRGRPDDRHAARSAAAGARGAGDEVRPGTRTALLPAVRAEAVVIMLGGPVMNLCSRSCCSAISCSASASRQTTTVGVARSASASCRPTSAARAGLPADRPPPPAARPGCAPATRSSVDGDARRRRGPRSRPAIRAQRRRPVADRRRARRAAADRAGHAGRHPSAPVDRRPGQAGEGRRPATPASARRLQLGHRPAPELQRQPSTAVLGMVGAPSADRRASSPIPRSWSASCQAAVRPGRARPERPDQRRRRRPGRRRDRELDGSGWRSRWRQLVLLVAARRAQHRARSCSTSSRCCRWTAATSPARSARALRRAVARLRGRPDPAPSTWPSAAGGLRASRALLVGMTVLLIVRRHRQPGQLR